MPTATVNPVLLPEPQQAWIKPTLSNTFGGKTYQPTHPDLFRVEFTASKGLEEGYASRLVALRDFAPNELITPLTNISLAPEKAYSSVQFGPGPSDHLELNSDLLFMNHSCSPTTEVHLPPLRPNEWAVYASSKGIKKGDSLEFFYPSTEWDMAQGFDCACGSDICLGKVNGAKYASLKELQARGYINEHILALKNAQSKYEE
ncbi:hypothetical protein C343_05046 [Cryptococcus neoformans C23]|uniref:SET domain-containing protein n=2 Tax=Cryptococcus neoformans TaxID=5207 RepID=A0A854QEZ4_CRYNE|nr:hypothetical protein CNAG_04186 [Cryptococcus neoformans var. grubii H99]AUB26886.1 hypothetical protein CKF44_04186 [Cryptococcus neoformans var. grubii]OWZ29224.1 hypothetical protein C347_05092 [Cryptococcus neoformans var. grubii AD2-60a]OWZ36101.1 hypothetical protein C353_04943 [Cryptococcus neoformans var. grubii AD1-83a]OWZ41090.1 hypothetical protein C343_05046 [Cryptococcus neoformans var. grubii C23]OWZ52160.1 hypothetical protein C368_05202 [Cryptococcus neoformans var. grubii 1|eukprot:XP_012051647.1 hypothetical protein CNAG_04186 [Cryptococcus neoformans var. grubii H99]